jgi:hypothetical protein
MPLLDLFWTILVFFCWVLWFWLLFRVYGDLFARQDTGGWAKTGWVVFTLLVPILGVFVYLISQGRSMAERAAREVERQRAGTDAYLRSVAADAQAEQLSKARDLAPTAAHYREQGRVPGQTPGPAPVSDAEAVSRVAGLDVLRRSRHGADGPVLGRHGVRRTVRRTSRSGPTGCSPSMTTPHGAGCTSSVGCWRWPRGPGSCGEVTGGPGSPVLSSRRSAPWRTSASWPPRPHGRHS